MTKNINGYEVYGLPSKKERFIKWVRKLNLGEKIKKVYNKTIIPDKVKEYKEKKKFVREIKEEARQEARGELKGVMKEQFKQQELNKLGRGGVGVTMDKVARGFSIQGQQRQGMDNPAAQTGDKIANMMGEGLEVVNENKIRDMIGLGNDKQLQETKTHKHKYKKKKKKRKNKQQPRQQPQQETNKINVFEDKIKRMLG